MDEPGESHVDPAERARRFTALRRVVARLLDEAEAIASRDESFCRDVMWLLGEQGPAEAPAAASPLASPPTPAAAPEPIVPPAMDAPVVGMEAPAPASPASEPGAFSARTEHEYIAPRVVEADVARYPRQWSAEPFNAMRVAARCRLKAEACRWQSQRSRLLDAGQDIAAGDRELVARARASDVYLWMVSPAKWRERSEEAFAVVAGCYDALADAAELMGLADRLGRSQEDAMKLIAEAQSSVRAAVEEYASARRDDDQESTFTWLRRETDERRVFVEYMQLDHPAPPNNFADLRQRIAALRGQFEQIRGRDKALRDAIKKIAWHADKLAHLPLAERADSSSSDFIRIAQAAEEALEMGLPPSDVALREALLPAVACMPADATLVPAPLARVLGAIDEYLDRRDTSAVEAELAQPVDAAGVLDPLVAKARQRVAGRSAVLIGGQPSEPHRLRLQDGLGLSSLEWVRVEHHQSFDAAARAIARPGVDLVLIMTRWRSHRDGPAARALCKERAIPLIELPTGYNLRQVAHQLVAQCGSQAETED